MRWQITIRNIFLGWIILVFTPGLLFASPLSPAAWGEATWQEHCRGIRTSYNPTQDLSDQAFTLTPADQRLPEFLLWVQSHKISEHRIEGVDGGGNGVPTGVVVHWAPDSRWERHTTISFGYAVAYLVGKLGWQDTDFPEFFAQYGGTYGVNLKDRLVLIDSLSASPWQDFFHFLRTLAPANVTLSHLTAVNPEKRTVTITAGRGKLVKISYEQFVDLLGQALTDCRAYEFFQAYDRRGKETPTGQEPAKGTVLQEAVVIAAAATSAKPSPAAPALQSQPEPNSSSALSRGHTLYEKECSVCHGVKGDGKGPFVEALFPRPRNFTMGLFRYRSTPTGQLPLDEDLYRTVSRGLPGTTMPAWGQFLPQEEIQEVITYLKGFSERFVKEKPTEIVTIPPAPPVTQEGLARGKQLYTDMGCVSCHGEDGKGQGSAGEDLKMAEGDPISPRDLTDKWSFRGGHTPQDVFLRLSTGLDGSPMPSYRGMVSDEELWDLVFYLLSLSPPERPWIAVRTPLFPGSTDKALEDRHY
jgi:cytochrome c oxidase cbb3-type subunit 2